MYKDNQERVDAYLRGEMDNETRIQFENELTINDALRQEYNSTKAIVDAIVDRRKKLNMMAFWDKEEETRQNAIKRRITIRRWTIGLSAAACIIVGFFYIKPFIYHSHSYEMPYFSHVNYSFGDDSGIEVLDSMINSGDYSNALAFAELLGHENRQRIQNIKDSHINNSNEYDIIKYGNADSILYNENIRIEQYEELLYNIEWRRINLILSLGRKEECIDALKEFSNKDGIYQSDAKSLLKKLSKH